MIGTACLAACVMMRHVLLVEVRFSRLSRASSRDQKKETRDGLGYDLGFLCRGGKCLQFEHGNLFCDPPEEGGVKERKGETSSHRVGPLLGGGPFLAGGKVDLWIVI